MTQKAILQLADNEEAMELLADIAHIQQNMCHKTIYERRTAQRKMKQYAAEIIKLLKGENDHE